MAHYLDFEKPLAEIEGKAEELRAMARQNEEMDVEKEAENLDLKAQKILVDLYKNLTPWRKCQIARHPERPHCKDYIKALFSEFVPLAGDRNFADDQTFANLVTFLHRKVSSHRQGVGAKHFLLFAHDQDSRVLLLVARFRNDDFAETRLLVKLFAVSDAVLDAFKSNSSLFFRNDDVVVWIPFAYRRVLLDLLPFLDEEHRSVGKHGGGQRHVCFGVHHLEFGGTRNHNHLFLAACVCAIHRAQVINLNHAFVLGADLVFV